MNNNFHLDFERPIVELENKIEELSDQADTGGVDIAQEVERLQSRVEEQRQKIYSNLSSWQKVQISRHPDQLLEHRFQQQPHFSQFEQSFFARHRLG